MTIIDRPPTEEELLAADPFYYGYRLVDMDDIPDPVMVPLTEDDLLHPQEGDYVTHNTLHHRIITYLYEVFCALVAHQTDTVVFSDVLIAWDAVPSIRPHGPDLMVIEGVRELREWSVFDVAEEGTRPSLIIEVTSPKTRRNDLYRKPDHYDRVGVPQYVIVDLHQRRGVFYPRLLTYRSVEGAYELDTPDADGRLWIERYGVGLAFDGETLVCTDREGTPIDGYSQLRQRADADAAARRDAERRVAELEAELRRLRGERS